MSSSLFGASSSGGYGSGRSYGQVAAGQGRQEEYDYSGWAAEAQGPVAGMSSSLFGASSSGGYGSGAARGGAAAPLAPGRVGGSAPASALQVALVSVDVNKLPPEAVWRTSHEPLYRNDARPWYIVFKQGFAPKNPSNTDLKDFLHSNAPSAYVATTRKKDLNWPYEGGDAYIYQIEAPGGIDANRTYPDTLRSDKYDEAEVDFPGGIAPAYITGCWALEEDGSRKWIPNDGT
ncbi:MULTISPECIES: hypothetical protein [unclassified Streptomyces]|uniref:scabin-related ADP-ribosyltransferase n=1 Tax=unclassified Streptomyces TaxID=2593676 RepID=UPI00331ED299